MKCFLNQFPDFLIHLFSNSLIHFVLASQRFSAPLCLSAFVAAKLCQTKPILPATAGKIALSKAEGPVLRYLSKQLHQICLLFRFAAVFGAQDADERIKEERQNRQPAYSHKYPAIKTHRIAFPPSVSGLFSARCAKLKETRRQKISITQYVSPIRTGHFP